MEDVVASIDEVLDHAEHGDAGADSRRLSPLRCSEPQRRLELLVPSEVNTAYVSICAHT